MATGEILPETALIRFIDGPDGQVVPDIRAKLPGRGVWVRADKDSIEAAVRRGAFSRSLKKAVNAPSDLAQQTESLLSKRCLDMLGLCFKSGDLAVGSTQVEEAVRRAPPFWLIEASDGAPDGRAKMIRLFFGLWGEEPRVAGCFTSEEMGVALGRAPVVHLAMLNESMAQRWTAEIGRLAGFRAITPPSWR